MDPMIEQYCRCHRREDLRPDWFSAFQRYLASVIQPKLNSLEAVELENEKLREELAAQRMENTELHRQLTGDHVFGGAANGLVIEPVKRKRGRPRKVRPEDVAVGA